MPIKATSLKAKLLKTGKKAGILIAPDSSVDELLTKGSKAAATVANESEKQVQRIATEARSIVDELRAKLHAATAPKPTPPPAPKAKPASRAKRK